MRLAQYETGSRKPKAELTGTLTQALDITDIDSQIGLMHTLFALEDIYCLAISETDGEVCLKISKNKGKAAELTTEEISREEYDQWRYNCPKFDTTQQWANVPSKELSDALVKTFKDKLKND